MNISHTIVQGMFKISKCILKTSVSVFLFFMHTKQLQKRKSIPLETVTENRAAEMDGSYEVRPFQSDF